jgi:hypothetical protein
MSASTIPAMISNGTPISKASNQGRRSERGCGMTWVAVPSAIGTIAPESRRTSVPPSGGRSAADLAMDSSATAVSVIGASGRSEWIAGGASYSWRRSRSTGLVVSNGSRPVSIRNRITPNE